MDADEDPWAENDHGLTLEKQDNETEKIDEILDELLERSLSDISDSDESSSPEEIGQMIKRNVIKRGEKEKQMKSCSMNAVFAAKHLRGNTD